LFFLTMTSFSALVAREEVYDIKVKPYELEREEFHKQTKKNDPVYEAFMFFTTLEKPAENVIHIGTFLAGFWIGTCKYCAPDRPIEKSYFTDVIILWQMIGLIPNLGSYCNEEQRKGLEKFLLSTYFLLIDDLKEVYLEIGSWTARETFPTKFRDLLDSQVKEIASIFASEKSPQDVTYQDTLKAVTQKVRTLIPQLSQVTA